eukprot:CAMPEP_0194187414 /NCGR_PEP_ID=MMETSP0154-20130528/50772_1 /TAXON_ID=1049557 /ORGANISM="Thalassiothrix antarctica, Strain L6-D1" /LENGTH=55 /DNA_ID=CAMNT_0038907103 /DNA_START=74 /DNA_END=238 /DNA_ORIENTATION=-
MQDEDFHLMKEMVESGNAVDVDSKAEGVKQEMERMVAVSAPFHLWRNLEVSQFDR